MRQASQNSNLPYPAPAPAPGDNDDLSRLNSNNDDRQGETDDGHPSSSASPSADEMSTSESMPRNIQRFSSFEDAIITKSESTERGSQHFSPSADANRANCVSMACGSQQFSPSADATTGNWHYPSSEAEETSHDQKVTTEIEMCSVILPTNLKEHGTEFQSNVATMVSKDHPSTSLTNKRGSEGGAMALIIGCGRRLFGLQSVTEGVRTDRNGAATIRLKITG